MPLLVEMAGYATDKGPDYLRVYERFFAPLRERRLTLLELGVLHGGSLELWRDYFPQGTIVGLDVELPALDDPSGRIRLYRGKQDDLELLEHVARTEAPSGFDVVIDDASHLAAPTRAAFWHLFERHLVPGGVYAIEDWGTGYWEKWPDGRKWEPSAVTHQAGMVGLIKELVDEVGAADITDAVHGSPPARRSRFEQLVVTPGLAIVQKSRA